MNKTIAIVSASTLAFMMSAGVVSAQIPMPIFGFGGDVVVNNMSSADVSNDISVESNTGDNDAEGGDAGAGARGGDARATRGDAEGGNGGDGGNGGRGGSIVTGDAISTSGVTNDVNRNETEVNYEDCGCEPAYNEYYRESHSVEADASLWYDQYEEDSSLTMGGSLHMSGSASSDFDDEYSESGSRNSQSSESDASGSQDSEKGMEMSGSESSDYSQDSNSSSDESGWEEHDNASGSQTTSEEGSSTSGGHHRGHGGTTEWDNLYEKDYDSAEGASGSSASESESDSASGSQQSEGSASAWDNYESEYDESEASESSRENHEKEHDVSLDEEHEASLDAEFAMHAEESKKSDKGTQDAHLSESHEVEYSRTAAPRAPQGSVYVTNAGAASVSNSVDVESDTGNNDVDGGDAEMGGRGGDARATGQDWFFMRGSRGHGGHHGSSNGAEADGGNGGDAGNGAAGGSVVTGVADSLSTALTIVNQSMTRVNR